MEHSHTTREKAKLLVEQPIWHAKGARRNK